MIGKTFLHYKITAKLGEGGMGAVYRARDSKLNRDVALKLLPQAFANDVERLARFQREARTLAALSRPWSEDLRPFEDVPVLSPDDRNLAIIIAAPDGVFEIWVSELDRAGLRRFVFEKGRDCSPLVWTPDASELVFLSFKPGSLRFLSISLDGVQSPRLLFESTSNTESYVPTCFADADKLLLVTHTSEGKSEILVHPFAENSSTDVPKQRLLADASNGQISPDGKWLAYGSESSGRNEIYLRRWLGAGELGREIRVSSEGGTSPFWYQSTADAPMEIWYGHNRKLYSSILTTEPQMNLSRPQFIVELTSRLRNFHKLKDGRILAQLGGEDEVDPGRLHVVLNWQNGISRLLDRSP